MAEPGILDLIPLVAIVVAKAATNGRPKHLPPRKSIAPDGD